LSSQTGNRRITPSAREYPAAPQHLVALSHLGRAVGEDREQSDRHRVDRAVLELCHEVGAGDAQRRCPEILSGMICFLLTVLSTQRKGK
jgi:hypothetical protein